MNPLFFVSEFVLLAGNYFAHGFRREIFSDPSSTDMLRDRGKLSRQSAQKNILVFQFPSETITLHEGYEDAQA